MEYQECIMGHGCEYEISLDQKSLKSHSSLNCSTLVSSSPCVGPSLWTGSRPIGLCHNWERLPTVQPACWKLLHHKCSGSSDYRTFVRSLAHQRKWRVSWMVLIRQARLLHSLLASWDVRLEWSRFVKLMRAHQFRPRHVLEPSQMSPPGANGEPMTDDEKFEDSIRCASPTATYANAFWMHSSLVSPPSTVFCERVAFYIYMVLAPVSAASVYTCINVSTILGVWFGMILGVNL